MQGLAQTVTEIVSWLDKNEEGNRIIVAVAGPPASGKSTLAGKLVDTLNARTLNKAALLPMDGFHLDNGLLSSMELLERKGAPQTFDFASFDTLLGQAKDCSRPIYHPTFDRRRDIAIAGSAVIEPGVEYVVVEGNYLLLDEAPWRGLRRYFDKTIFIETPLPVLRERLVQRWRDNGYDETGAAARAESNDIPNARLVMQRRLQASRCVVQTW